MNGLESKRLRLGEALNKVAKVGQALIYAHEHHIFHGGIKPENILLGADGQIFLTDFNLVDNNDLTLYDHITQENIFCYMASEQFTGICDTGSDQYALVCLTHKLFKYGTDRQYY
jgi:serine/threonine protein kinase